MGGFDLGQVLKQTQNACVSTRTVTIETWNALRSVVLNRRLQRFSAPLGPARKGGLHPSFRPSGARAGIQYLRATTPSRGLDFPFRGNDEGGK